ncbi:MAG: SIMPL domain-containing protein [Methylotetracoccus sp.]
MRLIKVAGEGSASAEPDTVRLSFEVQSSAWEYDETIMKLNRRTEDLRANLTSAGLDRAKLKTTDFGIHVDTTYKGDRRVFNGYRATHRLHIELPMDKALLNAVLNQIASGHSGAEISMGFSVRDQDVLRKRALTDAVHRANENAQVMAAAAGVRIGALAEMHHGAEPERIDGPSMRVYAQALSEPDDYHADIEPQAVRAEAAVTLVFELAD